MRCGITRESYATTIQKAARIIAKIARNAVVARKYEDSVRGTSYEHTHRKKIRADMNIASKKMA